MQDGGKGGIDAQEKGGVSTYGNYFVIDMVFLLERHHKTKELRRKPEKDAQFQISDYKRLQEIQEENRPREQHVFLMQHSQGIIHLTLFIELAAYDVLVYRPNACTC